MVGSEGSISISGVYIALVAGLRLNFCSCNNCVLKPPNSGVDDSETTCLKKSKSRSFALLAVHSAVLKILREELND